MPNKLLTIGAAVGVAALVLLLAMIVGGPGAGSQDQTPTIPENPELFTGSHLGGDELPIGEFDGLVYEIKESGILFYADRVVPQPQGVIDVIETTAQIHLAAGRELTIDADEGTIVAPDNHPREGEMRGNVVVTLYETPDGSPVDFESDRHVVTRIYFDDPVEFDLELQQIDSEGPIFMTGPQVQFLGKGLSLNYNQLRHRIERLVIQEGQSLHYIPKPKSPTATPTASPAKADSSAVALQNQTQPQTIPATVTADVPQTATAPTMASTTAAAASDTQHNDATARPVQFYLATFEELQDVRVGQDQYVIEGDDLSAVFSAKAAGELDDQEDPTVPATPPAPDPAEGAGTSQPTITGRSIELASSDPLRGALLHALAASIGQVPAESNSTNDPRSLASFTDEDVIITWSGRLVVSPLSDPPEEMAGPDDVMVSVRGTPTKINTDKGESVRAPKVSFFSLNSRLLTEGTPESPVRVNAPDMGTLIGRELSIDQLNGTGYVLGPGSLTGLIKEKARSADDIQSSATSSSDTRNPIPDTRSITVAFHDRLDLAFYLKDKSGTTTRATDSPAGKSRIKGIKTATFLGNVAVDYTELDMTAESLTLAMFEDPPEGDDKLAVSSLDAKGNIKADVKDQDVKILADRLHAEPASDKLELFGTPDNHAQVIRPDATLAGEHLVMDQQARTVNVLGPGWFDFTPDLAEPEKTVRVTWATRMNYDDAKGTARFLGNVKTLSTDGTDTNELMGDDLAMTFVKDDLADDGATESNFRGDRTAGRRLATATMTGHVRFRARSYETVELKPDQVLTELFMMGPLMTFNDPSLSAPAQAPGSTKADQKVQVIGTGRMLLTDTRPDDTSAGASKTKRGNKNAPIDLAGRGKTAFEWSDRLVLNMTDGIMTMKGAVAMVHQPQDGDRVQMDCQDLAADLKAPGGKKTKARRNGNVSGGWLAKDAPKPELERVWADGGIRILQGPYTITCDHLLYQEAKRDILLWSDDPRQVTYEVQGEPNLTKSSALKWHRDTGRIEVFKIRTGTIPLRRSERENK